MKFSSKLVLSVLSVGLSSQVFADDVVLAAKKAQKVQVMPQQELVAQTTQPAPKKSKIAPGMRKYKECETGLAYTFSTVTLGGFDNLPVFNSVSNTSAPEEVYQKYKNMTMKDVWEFNYNYLQTLEDSAHKVFFDLNYIHADGNTKAPLAVQTSTLAQSVFISPLFAGEELDANSENLPYFASIKTHFDLSSAQTGVSMRLYRTKNVDFSVFGGADTAYFTSRSKINYLGYSQSNLQYTKASENVSTVNDKSSMSPAALSLDTSNEISPFGSSIKTRYYGAGPLLGAKLQVPFNREYLRLNIKAEASALMGWGTSRFNYNLAVISDPTTSATLDSLLRVANNHRHVFRLVPTLRGEISLDVIIKNFMFTAGLQQAVYFQAFDISPMVDFSETAYQSAATTRDRFGQLVTGGFFLKASVLF